MSRSHNKRRNTGLIYEFLLRTMSRAVIEGDEKASSRALRVLRRNYRPGTELYREFRLINSLMRTTVSSEAIALSIVSEARTACRAHDVPMLDRQKSLLIRNVNHIINDESFYDQHINEYRMYATVQTLINDWRDRDSDPARIAQHEDQLVRWLVTDKTQPETSALVSESAGSARLLMKVMTKKLNEKYADVLSADQRDLVKAYMFSTVNADPALMRNRLREVKDSSLASIDAYVRDHGADAYVGEKLSHVKEQLMAESPENVVIDDATMTRFMLYVRLGAELSAEER